MRNILLSTAITFALCIGCKKDKVIKATNITNQQAAVMVATALATNANGFVSIKNDVVIYAKAITNAGKGCGVVDSFAVARQDATSSSINYNYALGYQYIVNCVNNVQDNLTANIIYHGSFDAANLTEVNTVTTAINLASLSGTETTYTLNGSYQSQGSFQTIDDTQLTGSNILLLNNLSIIANKSNRNIVSGSTSVAVSGSVKNKNTFNYTGVLVFKGSNIATLALEGINYQIDLTTADVTVI